MLKPIPRHETLIERQRCVGHDQATCSHINSSPRIVEHSSIQTGCIRRKVVNQRHHHLNSCSIQRPGIDRPHCCRKGKTSQSITLTESSISYACHSIWNDDMSCQSSALIECPVANLLDCAWQQQLTGQATATLKSLQPNGCDRIGHPIMRHLLGQSELARQIGIGCVISLWNIRILFFGY